MRGVFNRWGGGGGGGSGGAGRGGPPPRRPLGVGADPRQGFSFDDERDYDTAEDGREYYPPAGRGPPPARGVTYSPAEYEARRTAIFSTGSLDDHHDAGAGVGQPRPVPPRGNQGFEQWPHQGVASPQVAPAQGGGGLPSAPPPPVVQQPQGGAQIAVQPPASHGSAGTGQAHAPAGAGQINTPPQEYSGIASALERLAPLLTDADTARNLRWQREVDGDKDKLRVWQMEATGSSGLQFYAYMQPGEAFLVLGHSLSCIYSTTTDVSSYHGKLVLFIGDRTSTRECTPVILPTPSALGWLKCSICEDKSKLADWYADNRSEYGNYWDPLPADGARVEHHVPKLLALPLWAVKLYQEFKGPVMPHEMIASVERHLASDATTLDNGNDWNLVKTWLLVASQRSDGGGDPSKRKPFLAVRTDPLLSNDPLILRWITERLDASLGRRPDLTSTSTTVGIQGNMAVVQNMSGIIASEVGKGLGVAMQNAAKAGPSQLAGAGATSDDAKPYTQDQIATLLGFHGAMNVAYLTKVWRLFKSSKVPNYDYLRRTIKGEMLRWADGQRCWIEEGVYFDNKTLDEWIALKFNPGDSTALYSSADKGISILKCRAPTSAHLEDLRRQEEVWDATKGNATYVEVIKQAKSKDVCHPPHDFGELRSNISTFCALLFTLFGQGCDLYQSMMSILQILSHPFSMQNKQAYSPEVVRRIIWAIIVDTRSYFDDIKLADDFVEQGQYLQFPVSTLEGDFMAIKHGIKIQRHNFPSEWATPDPYQGHSGYYPGKGGGGGYVPHGVPSGPSIPWVPPQGGVKPPATPYNWRPTNWEETRHPKIQTMMEPLLTKYRGRCSVSSILTEGGKRFDSLPRLEAYPNGICWLNSIASCPYGVQCSYAGGHLPKGTLTDAQADEVVATLQAGVTAMVTRPSSPTRKRNRGGGRGRGAGVPEPPPAPQGA